MLFIQEQYQYLVSNNLKQEHYDTNQFDNQELVINLSSSVTGRQCLVVGSLTASPEQALQLLLLLHTLVQEHAQQVVLYAPYLGYQRQDCHKIGKSQGLLWADTMLCATGVQGVIAIEPHDEFFFQNLKTSVVMQSAESIFDVDMANFILNGFSFIFPDYGSIKRSAWIRETFPQVSYGYFSKKREQGIIQLHNFQGKISRKVIVYDDILDSGETLIQACIALKQMNVEEIVIFVTHAFFHGTAWNDLWNLGVKVLFCTNSTPQADRIDHPKIYVKSIMPLLQKYL